MRDIDKLKQLLNELNINYEEDYQELPFAKDIDEQDFVNKIIIIKNEDGEEVNFHFDEANGRYKNFDVYGI